MPIGRLALLFVLAAVPGDAFGPPPCSTPSPVRTRASMPHVRSTDPIVLAALARGVTMSATFRAMIEQLEASDVIVHIERREGGKVGSGFTQFITATRYARYLRITLAARDAADATVALLGHELRHALEAAAAPDVIDEASYRALYHEIGRSSCGPPQWCFDTAAAVRAGARVYAELHSARRSARLSAAQHHERQRND
jgi:hypothetical protein